ncbi:MAG: hypothetical protein IT536_02275 [Hyphomicrobiales bacterium]|nr:hypothetical protein [Hyphomicrobiales bacterium]
MRKDMAKVIVERPRRLVHAATNVQRNAAVEELPSKEGMRARHNRGYGGKELNENLAPPVSRQPGRQVLEQGLLRDIGEFARHPCGAAARARPPERLRGAGEEVARPLSRRTHKTV